MPLDTTRFGAIEIDADQVITFTQPIIGFPDYRRFLLIPGPPDSGITWLQSAEAGELAFLMMDPRAVAPDYTVPLGVGEKAELAAGGIDELQVYTLVVVPADRTQVRTNLRAPILINPRQRLGKQTVLDRSDYPIQYFLAARSGDTREAHHARADA